MKGRFIGEEGSLGFHKDEIYELESEVKYIPRKNVSWIILKDKNSKKWCPYTNLEKVLENWDFSVGRFKLEPLK